MVSIYPMQCESLFICVIVAQSVKNWYWPNHYQSEIILLTSESRVHVFCSSAFPNCFWNALHWAGDSDPGYIALWHSHLELMAILNNPNICALESVQAAFPFCTFFGNLLPLLVQKRRVDSLGDNKQRQSNFASTDNAIGLVGLRLDLVP